MAINIPNSGDNAGIAGSASETITQLDPLITGDIPAVFTTDEAVADNQNIPANTPEAATVDERPRAAEPAE